MAGVKARRAKHFLMSSVLASAALTTRGCSKATTLARQNHGIFYPHILVKANLFRVSKNAAMVDICLDCSGIDYDRCYMPG
jgi:hypothetical protein